MSESGVITDCKTCEHRHMIDGNYVRDCYSLCPEYQAFMSRLRKEQSARKEKRDLRDYVIESRIRNGKTHK